MRPFNLSSPENQALPVVNNSNASVRLKRFSLSYSCVPPTVLPDSNLIARKIAPCKQVFCASPDYLNQNGIPKIPQDLSSHSCLVYSNDLKPDTWTLHSPENIQSIKISGPVCADNGDILKAAAVAGLGITLLPTFIVGPDINAGRLLQILPDYCPPEISVYAVFPSRRYLSAKVRTFVDFLSEYFGDNPVWDE